MHVHHTIHELHFVRGTSGSHRFQFFAINRTWFFTHYMFSSIRSFYDPVFTHSGWERDVDRVEVIGCNHFIIPANRSWSLFKRSHALAFVDKFLRPSFIATCNCHDHSITGIANRIPILTRNICRSQNSPSQYLFHQQGYTLQSLSIHPKVFAMESWLSLYAPFYCSLFV